MHGAAPAVNPHGGPAMAGQIGTSGTGLDAPPTILIEQTCERGK